MARRRLLKKEPRGHPERRSDGHGPEAVPTVRSPRESPRRPRPGSGGHTRHAASPRQVKRRHTPWKLGDYGAAGNEPLSETARTSHTRGDGCDPEAALCSKHGTQRGIPKDP